VGQVEVYQLVLLLSLLVSPNNLHQKTFQLLMKKKNLLSSNPKRRMRIPARVWSRNFSSIEQ
jgi:hypothetical protein